MYGLNLLLYVCLLFYTRFFLDTQAFPSFQKPTFPNSNSARDQADKELLSRCAILKSLFNHLFFLINKPSSSASWYMWSLSIPVYWLIDSTHPLSGWHPLGILKGLNRKLLSSAKRWPHSILCSNQQNVAYSIRKETSNYFTSWSAATLAGTSALHPYSF